MPPKDKDDLKKKEVLQAVVIDDLLSSEFPSSGPKSLLPLANIKVLDYTLSCLSDVGVEQTFVYTAQNSRQLDDHIEQSNWNEPGTMSVKVVACEGCQSFGDLMRELDGRNVIQGDFLLLFADTVCTANLKPILEKHKATCLRDKNAVVTMVYTQAYPEHASRCEERELVLGMTNGRVVSHQRVNPKKRYLDVPLELLLSNPGVELRYDLLDPCISVCSLTVPPIFSDNFDFQTRDDFVKGLLLNEDILGHTMYAHILEDSYATRANSLPSYLAASMDVIKRWTFPFTPDASFSLIDGNYHYDIVSNVCKQSGVKIGRSEIEDCVIGSGTKIGNNCQLRMSVIGKNCTIGDNVDLCCSILWDNCVVESGFKGSYFLAPSKATLKLSGKNQTVAIASKKIKGDKSQKEPDSETESSEEESDNHVQVDEYESFFNEVQDSLLRGFREKVKTDDLVVEINSSRFANDIPADEVSQWVSKVIFSLLSQLKDSAKTVLSFFRPIFSKYVTKSENDQLNCLLALEEVTMNQPAETAKILGLLYNFEILEEDAIISWFKGSAGDQLKQQPNMKTFINWLQTAEEESEESD